MFQPSRLLGPYRVLAGNRDLALLFGGQVVSSLGDWMYIAALIALVYGLTGSATLAAALTFTRLLPYAIGLPLAGLLADRFDRRALMIAADLGRGWCMLALVGVSARERVWLAFPLVFVATALGCLFRPALGATLPSVARGEGELVRANALMSQIDAVSILLGPALSGVLILLGEPRIAFVANALTYALSAGTLLLLRPVRRERSGAATAGSWLAELAAGGRFLFGARGGALGAVALTTGALSMFNGASWTVLVVLAMQTWGYGSQGGSFLLVAYGVGGLLGGLVVGAILRQLGPVATFAWSLAAAGAAVVLFGLSPGGLLPFALLASFGVADVCNQVVGTTLVQSATPDDLQGRVLGAFEAIVVGTVLIGALATGPLVTLAGPRAATVALGLVALLELALALSHLRRLDDQRPASDPASPRVATPGNEPTVTL